MAAAGVCNLITQLLCCAWLAGQILSPFMCVERTPPPPPPPQPEPAAATETLDLRLRELSTVLNGHISVSVNRTGAAARDFGGIYSYPPAAVVDVATAEDVLRVVRHAHAHAVGEPRVGFRVRVTAAGHGHSVQGQAQVLGGIVIRMAGLSSVEIHGNPVDGGPPYYVEAQAGALWIDVLRKCLRHGLSPRSWTDYLHLSVGGTLSNAGVSGQAFRHGPQISNVYRLQIITGRGEVMNCSRQENADLFYAALGGLGQFGIITTAQIALERAPQMVKWVRVLYSDFEAFVTDQERLIVEHDNSSEGLDYVEGFVKMKKQDVVNNWRSSAFQQHNPSSDVNLAIAGVDILYCLEFAKYYNLGDDVDDKVRSLLQGLKYMAATLFTADVPYMDFLNRVHAGEKKLREQGLWDVPHPWLNFFIPRSKISVFNRRVFRGVLSNATDGPMLIYPITRDKWDMKMSAVTPEEERIFYMVALLRSAKPGNNAHLEQLLHQNQRIVEISERCSVGGKQYLPHYTSEQQWQKHFGRKWDELKRRKMDYDPYFILGSGHRIFASTIYPQRNIDDSVWTSALPYGRKLLLTALT